MRSLRVLILVALGVMALSAITAAAAQAASEWLVEGETFSELKLTEESAATSGATFKIAGTILGSGFTVECEKEEGTGKFTSEGLDQSTYKLSKCKVVAPVGCKVSEPISLEVSTELIETEGVTYDRVGPKTGETLTTIAVKECAIAGSYQLKGNVVGETAGEERVEQSLKFSEAISKKANEGRKAEGESEFKLTLGKEPATLTGELLQKLSGAEVGKEWQRVLPTKLCKRLERFCLVAQTLGIGTPVKAELEAEVKFKFEYENVMNEPACKVSKWEGTTTKAAAGEFTTGEFLECGGGLCEVTALETPYRFEFLKGGAVGNGSMTIRGKANNKSIVFQIKCAGGLECKYGAKKAVFAVVGGAPAKTTLAGGVQLGKEAGSKAGCANVGIWEGVAAAGGVLKYKFLEPLSLFITR